jgi:hypothetical protein
MRLTRVGGTHAAGRATPHHDSLQRLGGLKVMAKCQCGKELTDEDVCPLPSGRVCSRQPCAPRSWVPIEQELREIEEYQKLVDSNFPL